MSFLKNIVRAFPFKAPVEKTPSLSSPKVMWSKYSINGLKKVTQLIERYQDEFFISSQIIIIFLSNNFLVGGKNSTKFSRIIVVLMVMILKSQNWLKLLSIINNPLTQWSIYVCCLVRLCIYYLLIVQYFLVISKIHRA